MITHYAAMSLKYIRHIFEHPHWHKTREGVWIVKYRTQHKKIEYYTIKGA